MIWQANLYLLAAVGGVATLVWMLERRIYAMAAVSAGSWALVALTGATIQSHTLAGDVVTRPGWMVQVIAGFLAAVSFLAIVATYFDHYPPTDTDTEL